MARAPLGHCFQLVAVVSHHLLAVAAAAVAAELASSSSLEEAVGVGSPPCEEDASSAGHHSCSSRSYPPHQEDLLTQEIQELQGLVAASRDRIRHLEELQDALRQSPDGTGGRMLPLRRLLEEDVPLVEGVTEVEGLGGGREAPEAAAQDFLVWKAVLSLEEEPMDYVKFLPVASFQASFGDQLFSASALLVAASGAGSVLIYAPSGELLLRFSAGHSSRITQLAVSPGPELPLIATSDEAGLVRVHKVQVRQTRKRPLPRPPPRAVPHAVDDEQSSQFLGVAPLNVTVQLQRQLQVHSLGDEGGPAITALAMVNQKGVLHLVAGDEEGKVSVFARGGAFHGKIDTTSTPGVPVGGLAVHSSHLIFWAGAEWGYINLRKLEATHLECADFEGSVRAAVIDQKVATRVLVADDAGGVWSFRIRNRTDCRVEHRFSSSRAPMAAAAGGGGRAAGGRGALELAPLGSFLLGFEPGGAGAGPRAAAAARLFALNMSILSQAAVADAGRRPRLGPQYVALPMMPPASPVVWQHLPGHALQGWAVHPSSPGSENGLGEQQGDPAGGAGLVAILARGGWQLEIMEVLMPVRWHNQANWIWEMLPTICVILFGVLLLGVIGHFYLKDRRWWMAKKAKEAKEEAARMQAASKRAAAAQAAAQGAQGQPQRPTASSASPSSSSWSSAGRAPGAGGRRL